MKKVYDRFADEYIDESEKSPYAPPERYTEITEELLVENAARWFLTALKRLLDEEADRKTEPTISKMEQVDEPERNMAEDIVESFGFKAESYRQAKAKDEPQTERSE